MLLWLHGAPGPERLQQLFQSESFRKRVQEFIKANFRAHLPGVTTRQDLESIPVETDIAYSRPPNPQDDRYDEELANLEQKVARTKQVHTCTPATCLRLDRYGKLACKRHAPWSISQEVVVNDDGTYLLERLYAYINGWIRAICMNLRCNCDGKLLTNGDLTRGITYYVTMYLTKKQGRTFNASALWARALAYHFQASVQQEDLQERQRKLLFRAVNVLNREQEIAAPLVMAYLLGNGDVYRSHQYVSIYTSSLFNAIQQTWPELRA